MGCQAWGRPDHAEGRRRHWRNAVMGAAAVMMRWSTGLNAAIVGGPARPVRGRWCQMFREAKVSLKVKGRGALSFFDSLITATQSSLCVRV